MVTILRASNSRSVIKMHVSGPSPVLPRLGNSCKAVVSCERLPSLGSFWGEPQINSCGRQSAGPPMLGALKSISRPMTITFSRMIRPMTISNALNFEQRSGQDATSAFRAFQRPRDKQKKRANAFPLKRGLPYPVGPRFVVDWAFMGTQGTLVGKA